jgi:hypothetical protein
MSGGKLVIQGQEPEILVSTEPASDAPVSEVPKEENTEVPAEAIVQILHEANLEVSENSDSRTVSYPDVQPVEPVVPKQRGRRAKPKR